MDSSENKAPKNLNQNVTVLEKKKLFLNQRPRDFLEVMCNLIYTPFKKNTQTNNFVFAVDLFIISCSHLTDRGSAYLTLYLIPQDLSAF